MAFVNFGEHANYSWHETQWYAWVVCVYIYLRAVGVLDFKSAHFVYCILLLLFLWWSVTLCMVLVLNLLFRISRLAHSRCIFFLLNPFLFWSDWHLLSQNCGQMYYSELPMRLNCCYVAYLYKVYLVSLLRFLDSLLMYITGTIFSVYSCLCPVFAAILFCANYISCYRGGVDEF